MALFHCSSCGFSKTVPDKLTGREAKCPNCAALGRVVADEPPPSPPHDPDTDAAQDAALDDAVRAEAEIHSAVEAAMASLGEVDVDGVGSGDVGSGAEVPGDVGMGGADEADPPPPERGLVHCRMCGYRAEVPGSLVGKGAKCPECAKAVTIEPLLMDPPSEQDIDLESLEGTIRPAHEKLETEKAASRTLRERSEPADLTLQDPEEREKRPGLFYGSFPKNVFSGLTTGLVASIFCLAYATLIVPAGAIGEYIHHVTAMALVSASLGGLLIALGSRVPTSIGGAELSVSVLLYLLADSVQGAMAHGFSVNEVYATTVATIAITALVAGMIVFITGKMQCGDWVRYVPFPVVAGIMGGLGLIILGKVWLLLRGEPFTWHTLLGFFSADAIRSLFDPALLGTILDFKNSGIWVSAVSLGLVLFFVLRTFRNSLLLVFLLIFGTGIFYALMRHVGVDLGMGGGLSMEAILNLGMTPQGTMAEAIEKGYLFSGYDLFTEAQRVYSLEFLRLIRWEVIWEHCHFMLAMAGLTVALAMLKITQLEVTLGRELDLDAEFRTIGAAGVACGLAGGVPVSLSLGKTRGNIAMGAQGPVSGIVAALVCAGALWCMGLFLPFAPTFVPVAVLIYFGLSLVVRWVKNTRRELTHFEDYVLLLFLFAITAVLGVLVGVAVGAALALMVMISRYGRVPVVKHMLSGDNHRSNVDRGPDQMQVLDEVGESVFILRLQGFIFLGTTHGLLKTIRQRMEHRDLMPVRYLILDFTLVSGLDSSVALTFTKLQQLAWSQSITLIFTNVPFELEQQLEDGGFVLNDPDKGTVTFVNLDYAMEWCENLLLEEEGALEERDRKLAEILQPIFPSPQLIPELMPLLERVTVKEGDPVFSQGDPSDSMYFVESGQVNVELNVGKNKILRLKKMGYGTVFGEMGLYTDAPRSASIIATEDCVLYKLSDDTLENIRIQRPELYSAVNRLVVDLLAKRVAQANVRVRDLSR